MTGRYSTKAVFISLGKQQGPRVKPDDLSSPNKGKKILKENPGHPTSINCISKASCVFSYILVAEDA